MVHIEREQNPEILRQVATLLDRENRRLFDRIQKLIVENARLKGSDAAALQLEIQQLQELLAQREHTIFGASSEKRPRNGGRDESKPKAPQVGHGPTPQPQLPLLDETIELVPEQRTCPVCQGSLEPMGDLVEPSEDITVFRRSFMRVGRKRRKYRCRCNGAVITAPAPPKLIPGGRYTPEFAVEVAIQKYLDHLPLERQVGIMRRQGLDTTSQTLWDQIAALAEVLKPSYQALQPMILAAPVVHADETHWRLTEGKETSKWWVWSVSTREAVFYRLCGTRCEKSARALLSGYQGIVVCDGYAAYQALANPKKKKKPDADELGRDGPKLVLAHCWAHARRKFVEAEANYPDACGEALRRIGEIFAIEARVPYGHAVEPQAVLDQRQQLRTEESKPKVDELKVWATQRLTQALPRSGLGKALKYLLGHWEGLTRFLDNPRIPLDNNLAERELRGVVVGRKNHYGSRSQRGTEVAAIFYSLLETAKLVGADPYAYLLTATYAALDAPGTVTLPTAPCP